MKTCQVKINGVACGKPSFTDSSHECEDHFAEKFQVTYSRIKKQERDRRAEADAYEKEMQEKRRGFDV